LRPINSDELEVMNETAGIRKENKFFTASYEEQF
jgi:hypothetical protein